jgi:uncharacterized protein with HEPN domain
MSERPTREWRFYVDDMIGFAEKVIAYTAQLDQTAFVVSELNYDATLRNLELIGEAATHIPDAVRAAHPQVPWRLIIATRNRLIHGYLGIDNDTLWSIIQSDIPVLLPGCGTSGNGLPDATGRRHECLPRPSSCFSIEQKTFGMFGTDHGIRSTALRPSRFLP